MKSVSSAPTFVLLGFLAACTSPTEGSLPQAETLTVTVEDVRFAVSRPGVTEYHGIAISADGTRLRIAGTISTGSSGYVFSGGMVVRDSTIEIVVRGSVPPYTFVLDYIMLYDLNAVSIPVPAGTYRVNAMVLDDHYRLRAEANETITIPAG